MLFCFNNFLAKPEKRYVMTYFIDPDVIWLFISSLKSTNYRLQIEVVTINYIPTFVEIWCKLNLPIISIIMLTVHDNMIPPRDDKQGMLDGVQKTAERRFNLLHEHFTIFSNTTRPENELVIGFNFKFTTKKRETE
jgi:hypothetical protein